MGNTEVEITSERIDDIPLIVEWLKQLGIAKQIDKNLERPHGNHQGLSYGQLSVLLLTYMISQQDHRLCAVEPWVKTHREILELSTGGTIGEKDASDDRLARVVEELGKQEEARQAIERKVGKLMIRAYELPTEVGRVDTSSFSINHQARESEAESLLRYGYSKDRRPDLLQYKQLLGTLDPAGIPLISATVPGNGADDPLYWPAWQEMAQVIGHKDFVFLADSKAAAIATRARIADSGGIYCFPVPMSGQNPLWLKQWVLDPPAPPAEIRLPGQEADEPSVGKGFEVELGKFWWHSENQQWVRWQERYLVVYSESLASATLKGLHQRLEQAREGLKQLAAKPGDDLGQLDLKVKALLQRHRVKDFLLVKTREEIFIETRYLGRGRPTVNSPTEQVQCRRLFLEFELKDVPWEQAQKLAGWRLYVTNAPLARLSLDQAVFYYREQWLLERSFHRFKRGCLPALPIYFQNEDRIVGLMFLLTLALRVFTLIEFVVRQALQKTEQSLSGLYDGNPRRTTQRPSAEQLLHAFSDITLYRLPDLTIFITPLSALQRQILSLMKLPESIYQLHPRPGKT